MVSEKERQLQETLFELNAVLRGLTKDERAFVDGITEIQSRLQAVQSIGNDLMPKDKNVRLACFYPKGGIDSFQKLLKKLHKAAIIITRKEWCFEIVASQALSFDIFDDRAVRESALSARAEALIVITPGALSLNDDRGIFSRTIRLGHVGSLFHYADLMLDMAGHFHVPVAPCLRTCDVSLP